MIASRNVEIINAAAEKLQNYCVDGAEVVGLQCNIRDRESVEQMVQSTIEKFGRVDGLVNNGGGQFWSPAENINAKVFLCFAKYLKTFQI